MCSSERFRTVCSPDFQIGQLLIAGYFIYLGSLVKIWFCSVVPKP